MGKLTARKVETAKTGKYGDGAGLSLTVRKTGAKSWGFRFMFNGKRREMGLGPYPVVSLAKARQLAGDARRLYFEGIDPIQARQADQSKRTTPTYQSALARYIYQHRHGWKRYHDKKRWAATMRAYALPHLGSKRVDEIETADVLHVLNPIWTSKNPTAKLLQTRIEAVMDAASAQGHRGQFNPARWKGYLDKILPKPSKVRPTKHMEAMPFKGLTEFMLRLRAEESMAAKALEFVILTACRSGCARVATWDQIDLAENVWTIPAPTMKGGQEFRIPLSCAVQQLLSELPRLKGNNHLFPGQSYDQPIGSFMMLKHLRDQMGETCTVHGFRSTFRDWAGETTNTANHIVEMAMSHAIRDQAEAAYRRGDLFEKRRVLMENWAAYCSTTGQVLPFSRDSGSQTD